MSDLEARIARFQALAEQHPHSELPRFSLGQVYLEARRFEDAAEVFGEVARLKPEYMMAFVHRAQALFALERFEEAKAAAKRAIELAKAQNHVGPRIECEQLLDRIEEELE